MMLPCFTSQKSLLHFSTCMNVKLLTGILNQKTYSLDRMVIWRLLILVSPKKLLIEVIHYVVHLNILPLKLLWDMDIIMELTGGLLEFYYMKWYLGKYSIIFIFFKCFIYVYYRYPPFYDSNPYEIYKRIAIGFYEFP